MIRIPFHVVASILLTFCHQCHGFPSGAPLNACQEMRPYHPPTTTSGTAPFEINITRTSYLPGEEITGTIFSPSGVLFRGLLLEARLIDGSSSSAIGVFIVSDNNTHTNCGDKNQQGLTHNDNSNKTSIGFTWQAPQTPMGDIQFKLTVVESYDVSRFWLDIKSSNITDSCKQNSKLPQCADVTTVEPTTTTDMHTSTPNANPTTPSSNVIEWDPECGKTKGCFPDCPGGCDYLVKWQTLETNDDDDDVTHFEVQMKVKSGSDIWVAIGFAPSKNMDGTDVVASLSQSSNTSVESSYNVGHSNMLYNTKTVGLSNMRSSSTNGIISFSFTRLKEMDDMPQFMSLEEELFLQIATGPVVQGIKQQHTDLPVRSSKKINFMKSGVAKESDSASTLIKLHGTLMVVAWILCSTIGVVVARHCKEMMFDKLLCNVKYWFLLHRTLMFCVVLCVISGIIIIFYENGGFQKITSVAAGKDYTKAHPYLGIVVTVLALANPLMALFRPSPEHRSRPLFNWAHFTIGTAAHILAVITVFLGIHLSKAKVNEYAQYVVITYYVLYVLVQFILETHKRCDRKNLSTNEGDYSSFNTTTDMKNASIGEMIITETDKTEFQKRSSVPSTLLTLLAVSVFAITVLLIVMICDPKEIFS